jgi:hypothetical protein
VAIILGGVAGAVIAPRLRSKGGVAGMALVSGFYALVLMAVRWLPSGANHEREGGAGHSPDCVGKEASALVLLGSDAVFLAGVAAAERAGEDAKWKALSLSTDFDGLRACQHRCRAPA